jgi:signal transduction histidine kinase
MASLDEQPAETVQLLERFAYVLNLTFTRFNDLKIAEAHAIQAEHDLIEIKAAKKKAEDTLTELQLAQAQLIQAEKMASLGELTAGIAHEIQNPLNFVNNFSEINTELIEDLKAGLATGNWQLATEIADDIKENEQKIIHHGKRADAIVKGMLQHSRASSGQKEPTDINALCDEYLRLSYHGMRAKEKNFNATLQTDFDNSIGKINVMPQDIGRVLLNLFNNAFYAVMERQKLEGESLPGVQTGYKAVITVSTKLISPLPGGLRGAEIRVRDNGPGIPPNIVDKIFQPFFTTKPTGQGTGLGLSLSYDIIKAHSGEMKVETPSDRVIRAGLSAESAAQPGKEGQGTEFIIRIPIAPL